MKKILVFLVAVSATVALFAQPCFMFIEHPNDSLVVEACKYYKLSNIKYVLAQAKHETGNYTSNVCKKNNNLFGLRKGKNYIKFSHWYDSVKAYRDLVQYKHKNNEKYDTFLVRIKYAEDPNYIKKIKLIVKSIS